ncbi:MAG: UPF0271 protein [Granulosicoccus sp.]|jgi:UPF0271 protein
MFQTLAMAHKNNVSVGAHPSYNDREGFGRRVIPMAPAEIGRMVAAQIGALISMAKLAGTSVSYVKPHGALGNLAARDTNVATEIASVVFQIDPALAILAVSGTALEDAARSAEIPVYSEIFADRGYLSSGQLVPRGQDGAMIHDAQEAAEHLLSFLRTGHMPVIDGDPIPLDAHSICVHGDNSTAVTMAREIRERLLAAGFVVKHFMPT